MNELRTTRGVYWLSNTGSECTTNYTVKSISRLRDCQVRVHPLERYFQLRDDYTDNLVGVLGGHPVGRRESGN